MAEYTGKKRQIRMGSRRVFRPFQRIPRFPCSTGWATTTRLKTGY